jgi:hypothetical protein
MIIRNLLIAAASIVVFSSCRPSRVYVRERPTAPYYARPTPPYANAVWIDGEWAWRNGRYEYLNPHYVTPRRGRAWNPGHWESRRRGQVWVGGKWR